MPNKPLALALAGLLIVAPCGRAADGGSSRLERRAAERGPIRRQMEAALTVPASAIAAEAVEHARGQGSRPSVGNAPRIHPLVWVAIGLACIYALLLEWGRGWSRL